MKHPTSFCSLRILTGLLLVFAPSLWNWSDWSDLIPPRPWIDHCVGAAMWSDFLGPKGLGPSWTQWEWRYSYPVGPVVGISWCFCLFKLPSYLAGSNSCCWYPQCSWVYQDDLWTEVPGDQSAWSGASLPLGISGVELPQLEDVCQSSYVPWSNGGLYIP